MRQSIRNARQTTVPAKNKTTMNNRESFLPVEGLPLLSSFGHIAAVHLCNKTTVKTKVASVINRSDITPEILHNKSPYFHLSSSSDATINGIVIKATQMSDTATFKRRTLRKFDFPGRRYPSTHMSELPMIFVAHMPIIAAASNERAMGEISYASISSSLSAGTSSQFSPFILEYERRFSTNFIPPKARITPRLFWHFGYAMFW